MRTSADHPGAGCAGAFTVVRQFPLLQDAHRAGRLRVVASRASDFFGPGAGGGSVAGGSA